MPFISLRKPAPEPDAGLEDVELEAVEDDGQDQEPEGHTLGLLPALYQGVRGWCAWCSARTGAGPTWAVHGAALYAAEHYNVWVTCAVTGGFVLVVGLFTPRAAFDHLAARIEARAEARSLLPDDEPAQTHNEPPADPLPTLIWTLIGEAPGVHRKTLAEVLAEAAAREGQQPPSEAHVEAALEALGIPLRPSVRDARGKVNRGVHRADLEAWQRALPSTENTAHATGL